LYGYGGIVNEWGTIGLLLLKVAAERIIGDGALKTWGVVDKATRVKLCMSEEAIDHDKHSITPFTSFPPLWMVLVPLFPLSHHGSTVIGEA
jgi:hypothetical protein